MNLRFLRKQGERDRKRKSPKTEPWARQYFTYKGFSSFLQRLVKKDRRGREVVGVECPAN